MTIPYRAATKGSGQSVAVPLLLFLTVCGALRAETYYLTIAGLGGEQEYEQRFSGWASEIDKILKSEFFAKFFVT